MGRPLKFKTVKELEERVEVYFGECDQNGRPYTMAGLAVALGTSRPTLVNYAGRKGYAEVIQRAKDRCEAYAEACLFSGKGATGVIFNLKNNYEGWKDKSEVEAGLSGRLEIRVVDEDEDKTPPTPHVDAPAADPSAGDSAGPALKSGGEPSGPASDDE
jgi:hypothetical protein